MKLKIPAVNSEAVEEKAKELGNDGIKYAIAELHLHSALTAISVVAKHVFMAELEEKMQLLVLFGLVTGGSIGIRYVFPKMKKKHIEHVEKKKAAKTPVQFHWERF